MVLGGRSAVGFSFEFRVSILCFGERRWGLCSCMKLVYSRIEAHLYMCVCMSVELEACYRPIPIVTSLSFLIKHWYLLYLSRCSSISVFVLSHVRLRLEPCAHPLESGGRSILDHVEGRCTWDTFCQSFCLFLSPAPWFKAPVVPPCSGTYSRKTARPVFALTGVFQLCSWKPIGDGSDLSRAH